MISLVFNVTYIESGGSYSVLKKHKIEMNGNLVKLKNCMYALIVGVTLKGHV
jgi:hypothetical protein